MYSVQGHKCVSYDIFMYRFQKHKVCELTSSVFCSFFYACLGRNNYTFRAASLGRLWNILYEKNRYNFASLSCEKTAVVYLGQNLIMQC